MTAVAYDSYVVFDCDIGTDDAWALLMLLRAETYAKSLDKVPESLAPGRFKLAAVTTVHGNTDVINGTRNAHYILNAVQRLDVPTFKGCAEPLIPRTWQRRSFFHGTDGLGNVVESQMTLGNVETSKEHAVNAMYRLACEHSNQIDFILCGPLTNFAMCINLYGDEFLDKVRGVFIMGGNIYGKGNITKSAEFNFMMDPEAAHIVMERIKKPAVLLPWETCIDGDFGLTLDWRLNELGAVNTPIMELLNRAERAILVPKGFIKWMTCDAMLMAAYLFPSHLVDDQRDYYATVELSGTHTRGQLVLDHLRGRVVDHLHGKAVNVRVIRQLNTEHYRRVISWTGELPGVDIEGMWKTTIKN